MNPIKIENTTQLKNQFSNNELFKLFKNQVNKDFTLTGIDLDSNFRNLDSEKLFEYLTNELTYLIDNNSKQLLNLLYRIDVPEEQIANCIKQSKQDIYSKITFIILKRIWMKIWYQLNY